MWPHMFDKVAAEYDRRYGIDDSHLRAIAQVNFANARNNPNAQTRGGRFRTRSPRTTTQTPSSMGASVASTAAR